jgi:hypothetical protein
MHYELKVYITVAEKVHIINDKKVPQKQHLFLFLQFCMLCPKKMVKKKIYLPLFFHSLLIWRPLIMFQASIKKCGKYKMFQDKIIIFNLVPLRRPYIQKSSKPHP